MLFPLCRCVFSFFIPSIFEMRGLDTHFLVGGRSFVCFAVFSISSTSCPSLCLVTEVWNEMKTEMKSVLRGNKTLVSSLGLSQIYLDDFPPDLPEVWIVNRESEHFFNTPKHFRFSTSLVHLPPSSHPPSVSSLPHFF